MQRIVRLSDCEGVTFTHREYGAELIREAIKAQLARGLRFDNRAGVTSTDAGWISRYSTPSEFEPYADSESLALGEFRPWIMNSASRLSRGLAA